MKITSYNIQNVFLRHKDFLDITAGRCSHNWLNEMNELVKKVPKNDNEIRRLKELSFLIGFDRKDASNYAVLRSRGGQLYVHKCGFPKGLKANHFNNWNGWIALPSLPLDPIAVENKARVISEINADVMLLQEVEDKSSLNEMNTHIFPRFYCSPYKEVLILQGNDERGQEMAIGTKNGYIIKSVRSLMRERIEDQLLFSKNLMIYEICTPLNNTVMLIGTHLEDQSREKEVADRVRFKQAQRIAQVYKELQEEGHKNIIIAGTFNVVSYCDSISPLLRGTGLKEVTKHESFNVDFDEGTDADYYRLGGYKMGVNIKQKDYILVSPALFKKVKAAGLHRKGVFPFKKPQWPIYQNINSQYQAASEHPALWVEMEI